MPGKVVRDEAAQQRPHHRGDAEGKPRESLEPASLAGREQVGAGCKAGGHETAAADALQGAGGDELIHGLTETRRNGAKHENDQAKEQEHPAPVDVGEPADNRNHHRGGHQIGGRRPRVAVKTAEVGDDSRHGGGEDGLAEGGQEHRQHDAEHRQRQLSFGELDKGSGYGGIAVCFRAGVFCAGGSHGW